MSQAARRITTPDSKLLALCAQALSLQSALSIAAEHDAVVQQLIATPARTLDGLRAKARLVIDLHDGPVDLDMLDADDDRLAMSIVNDLAAMDA